jgi:RNA polymerase sigma-70 factor (ECF subfamily)
MAPRFELRSSVDHTGGRPEGIAGDNPDGESLRKYPVWEAADDALLAGLATGDQDAAIAFVRRFQQRVFGLALLIVRDPGRAEDVAQEAFVRAWRHAPAYDARRGSVVTWLLTITRNLAIDAIRMGRSRPSDLVPMVDGVWADAGPLPDELAGRDAEMTMVRAALARLPVEQRRAVLLAAFYGRTAQEISEIESIPLGTAKTRIRSGLHRLRAALAVEEPSE